LKKYLARPGMMLNEKIDFSSAIDFTLRLIINVGGMGFKFSKEDKGLYTMDMVVKENKILFSEPEMRPFPK
jgi:hypothetical protein